MAVMEDVEHDLPPKKKKKPPTEDEKRRKKNVAGTLMKALMRPGGGEATPSDGDQVMYHCTVRTLDGVVVESTRSEYGGKGIPVRHVLGKSKMLLGLLEGILTMQKGEVAMRNELLIRPADLYLYEGEELSFYEVLLRARQRRESLLITFPLGGLLRILSLW